MGISVRKAAKKYSVPVQTLRDRVKGKVDMEKVTMGPAPLLGQEEEAMLVSHLKEMAALGYGYTRQEVTNIASDYAIQLGKKTKQQKPLTLKWFRGLMKRWPDLKVVKPRALEYQRAKSANPGNVKKYFDELSTILKKYSLLDKPHRIFNIDEKGITLNHVPPHVVSGTGQTPQAVTTGKSSTVTILGCGSASGVAIPPYFVFPGMRMRTELMEGATPGATGDVSESGWSNSVIFLQYLQNHFLQHVPGGLHEPVLLLLDGHKSHVSVAAVEWAKEHNVILHVLPAHTSHILQPMDVGCYGPLQKIYNNLCHKQMRETSTVILKQDICSLACRAYTKALSAENLQSAFRKCGIYPFNADVVPAEAMAPSYAILTVTHEENQEMAEADEDDNDVIVENNSLNFFAERTRELVHVKSEGSRAKKPRNTLSKITSGRAITELEVSNKIKEHVSSNKKSTGKSHANARNKKTSCRTNNDSQEPGPSYMGPTSSKKINTSHHTKDHSQEPGSTNRYLLSEDSEDVSISEEELCCICKKYTPEAVRQSASLIFVKWVQCDMCRHWVHLNYCTDIRVIRIGDQYKCPHCK